MGEARDILRDLRAGKRVSAKAVNEAIDSINIMIDAAVKNGMDSHAARLRDTRENLLIYKRGPRKKTEILKELKLAGMTKKAFEAKGDYKKAMLWHTAEDDLRKEFDYALKGKTYILNRESQRLISITGTQEEMKL